MDFIKRLNCKTHSYQTIEKQITPHHIIRICKCTNCGEIRTFRDRKI